MFVKCVRLLSAELHITLPNASFKKFKKNKNRDSNIWITQGIQGSREKLKSTHIILKTT